jgi:hypothetical protein
MTVSTSQTATVRPATSGAYLAASALYNAGFRGWALTIMTAIAGRESNWKPSALNNNPGTGDYSVGLTQINYYGDLLNGRTASYGAPATLSSSPQAQANATFDLAGGNSLSGLGNWKLAASPDNGTVPQPTANGYSITPWLAQAATAVGMVGTLGPAPASQIANETAWPGTPADTSAQLAALPASLTSAVASSSSGTGCGSLGNVFTGTSLPVVGSIIPTFTRCQAKGLLGGLAIAGGGMLMVTGLALIVVAGLRGKGPAVPLVQTAQATMRLPGIRNLARSSS